MPVVFYQWKDGFFLFHWQGRVYGALCMTRCIFKVNVVCIDDFSAANKYYSSASHHEQKQKKPPVKLNFWQSQ